MKPEEIIISIPGGDVAALAWGNPNKPPVLAAHGWLDNAASFNLLAPLLSEYRVVVIDLPGHGFSFHRPPGSYFHFIDYVADIVMIIKTLKWQNCFLLGHSLGAGIFTIVASCFPELVKKAVLIDALAPFATAAEEMPTRLHRSITQYWRLAEKNPPCYASLEDAIAARAKTSPMKPESVKILVERGLRKDPDGYRWRNDIKLMLKSMLMMTEEQVCAYLRAIQAPICLIRPDQGWPVDEQLFKQRLAQVNSVQLERIPGHHHVHLDTPQLVAPIIQQFFKDKP